VTSEDLRSELETVPFRPLRIHLVSGKTVDIGREGQAFMLQNAVMIIPDPAAERYDIVALRNIERIERME
jgi:hypothetical protein